MNTVTLNEKDGIKLNFSLLDKRSGVSYFFSGTPEEVITQLKICGNAEFINQFLGAFSSVLSSYLLWHLDALILNCNDDNEILTYAEKRPELTNHANFVSTIIALNPCSTLLIKLTLFCKGKHFTELEDFIVSRKVAYEMYSISKSPEADLLKLKKAIFETDSYYYICNFCHDYQSKPGIIEVSDIEKLEAEALSSTDVHKAVHLAHYVEGVNEKKLEQHVLASGDASAMYCFACNVKGASIDLIRSAILKTKDMNYINPFVGKFGLGKSFADKLNYLKRKVGDKLFEDC